MGDPLFDDLLGLMCFARVVEHRSFTGAATALGVSKSVVSARVSLLEQRLGERLLIRTTRKLTVTEAGLHVYSYSARMLEEARAATLGASDVGKGLIRVNAPVTFAHMYLTAPLTKFMAAFPEVTIQLSISDRVVDLVEERVDVAIRVTKLKDSSLIARRLASTALHIVGAPAYLAERGIPERPEDLLQHECLRYTRLRVEEEWRLYGAKGRIQVPVKSRFQASNGTILREAALTGIGLVVLPRFMIHEDLRAGRLVPVLEAYCPRPLGIYALQVQRRVQPPRVKALIETLAREFEPAPWR
jgi:DNA-binding transcriptional LysR family regulator